MSDNLSHIPDDLLVKYLLGECTEDEAAQVDRWIAMDASNARYFNQLRELWEESKRLAHKSTVDEDAAWRKFQRRISKLQPDVGKPVFRMGWMRIAAAFIVVTGIAVLALVLLHEKEPDQLLVSSFDKVVTDTLPDGSMITLNKNSSISYPEKFDNATREVTLQGEAFFEVAPDTDHPFEIKVNDVVVKVIGTSFNIRSEKGKTEVIVATGKVQVTRNNETVELNPGQKVVADAGIKMLPEAEKEELYKYYQSHEFVCDNTPLWRLVEVLSDAYGSQIIIERPELRNLPLNTTFSNESLDVILDIIQQTFNEYKIQVIRTGNKIILR